MTEIRAKQGWFKRFLSWIERAGNKLPDPVTLFVAYRTFILSMSLCGYLKGGILE
jgi:p-aminobenzoyl-glutamate transporter AbgT